MSYTIEYKRKVYKNKEKGDWDERYFALAKQGDSNYYEQNGQRVIDWDLISKGSDCSIVEEVCNRAGSCEGGRLKRGVGFQIISWTPEEYISVWRETIKNAFPLEKIFEDFDIEVAITFPKDEPTEDLKDRVGEYSLKRVREALKQYAEDWYTEDDYYHPELTVYSKDIKDIPQFLQFCDLPDWRRSREVKRSFNFKEKQINKK